MMIMMMMMMMMMMRIITHKNTDDAVDDDVDDNEKKSNREKENAANLTMPRIRLPLIATTDTRHQPSRRAKQAKTFITIPTVHTPPMTACTTVRHTRLQVPAVTQHPPHAGNIPQTKGEGSNRDAAKRTGIQIPAKHSNSR